MNILKASVKDFLTLPKRKWNEDVGTFDSLIILPMKYKHDSGYKCMDFVAARGEEAFVRLSGCSDVLHLNGIGGYGESITKTLIAPTIAWSIDCLPKSNLLRLFADDCVFKVGLALSSFCLYPIKK